MARSTTKRPAAGKNGTRREKIRLQDARVEVEWRGKGKPVLLLQSEEAYESSLPLIDKLAERREVIMPWAPGYGRSTLPDSVTSIDDISYLYLDLLDHYRLSGVALIGFSLGGWIAAEMATKNSERMNRLVLVDTVGAKFGGKFDRDIADIYYLPADDVRALKFHDPVKDPLYEMTALSDREALRVAQHRETTAKLCWEPYFHNPSLKYRLGRIKTRTLVVWGAKDGFVAPKYGRAFAKRIPGAKFVSLKGAGHYPHIEQPDAFLKEVRAFLR